MYKIPYRDIYCDSIKSWVKEVAWVFIVRKLFKEDIEAISCHCNISQYPQ